MIKNNPVLWIGLVVSILQVVSSVLNKQPIDETAFTSILTIVGAIYGHALTTPTHQIKDSNNA